MASSAGCHRVSGDLSPRSLIPIAGWAGRGESMRFSPRLVLLGLIAALPLAAICQEQVTAPEPGIDQSHTDDSLLPDAPQPQAAIAVEGGFEAQQATTESSSSSQSATPQPASQKSAHDQAEEQLKQQEQQRVAGVMATFNTTTNRDALPLSSGQKFQLFFRSEIDPWPFLLSAIVGGVNQASNAEPEWGQGVQGYAKRFGAAYSDAFIGNFFGNAVLTSLLHEDPRYFQKGTGSKWSRFLWAATSTVWCKRDKGGWGPNYANVGGNLIGTAVARVYYPAQERTVSDTITDGLTVSAEGIVGSEVIEFWPDLSRYMKRKHDEKLARQAAKADKEGRPEKSTK